MTAKQIYKLFQRLYEEHGDILCCEMEYEDLPLNIRQSLKEKENKI